jgi:hypothetical protein
MPKGPREARSARPLLSFKLYHYLAVTIVDTTDGPTTEACLTYLNVRGGALPTSPPRVFCATLGNEGPDVSHLAPLFMCAYPRSRQ